MKFPANMFANIKHKERLRLTAGKQTKSPMFSISAFTTAQQNHSYSYSRGNSRTSELLTTRVVTLCGIHQYDLYVS